MEIKFGINEVKKVLESYYKKNEDFDGKVKIECSVGRGFGMNEYYDVLEFNAAIEGKLSIYGMEVPMVRQITIDEVKTVFRSVIEEVGQTVSDVTLDYGLTSEVVGYGLAEHTEKKAYFNGVNVSVKNKTYVKTSNW